MQIQNTPRVEISQQHFQDLLELSPLEFANRLGQMHASSVMIENDAGHPKCSIPELQSFAVEIARLPSYRGHEAIFIQADNVTGSLFVVAVHNTHRGQALGGCREATYDKVGDVINDVLRLSHGMTRKNAISGINFGGGKGIIARMPGRDFSDTILRRAAYESWGRFVNGLNGLYITAEDMGNTIEDVEIMRRQTIHVVCLPTQVGGSGNPSPVTAYGVYLAIKACFKYAYGDDGLEGRKIVVQGVGNVGTHLTRYLLENNAEVYVSDIDNCAIRNIKQKHPKLKTVPADRALREPCDVLAPSAVGGLINGSTIPTLNCKILCGPANNVLGNDIEDGIELKNRGVIYPVDYSVNRAGAINGAQEPSGYNWEEVKAKVEKIYPDTIYILETAEKRDVLPLQIANELADERALSVNPFLGHLGSKRIPQLFKVACLSRHLN